MEVRNKIHTFVYEILKTDFMNEMNFHEFYDYLWEDDVLEIILSTKYLEENKDFIRNYSLDLFRLYEMSRMKPQLIKKMVEITFTNLFIFNPGTENIKEIQDGFRNSYTD